MSIPPQGPHASSPEHGGGPHAVPPEQAHPEAHAANQVNPEQAGGPGRHAYSPPAGGTAPTTDAPHIGGPGESPSRAGQWYSSDDAASAQPPAHSAPQPPTQPVQPPRPESPVQPVAPAASGAHNNAHGMQWGSPNAPAGTVPHRQSVKDTQVPPSAAHTTAREQGMYQVHDASQGGTVGTAGAASYPNASGPTPYGEGYGQGAPGRYPGQPSQQAQPTQPYHGQPAQVAQSAQPYPTQPVQGAPGTNTGYASYPQSASGAYPVHGAQAAQPYQGQMAPAGGYAPPGGGYGGGQGSFPPASAQGEPVKKKGKGKMIALILLAVLVLCAAGFAVWKYLLHDSDKASEVTRAQFQSGIVESLDGVFDEQGEVTGDQMAACITSRTFSAVSDETKALVAKSKEIPESSPDYKVFLDATSECHTELFVGAEGLTFDTYLLGISKILQEASPDLPADLIDEVARCVADESWDEVSDQTKARISQGIDVTEENPDYQFLSSTASQCVRDHQ